MYHRDYGGTGMKNLLTEEDYPTIKGFPCSR